MTYEHAMEKVASLLDIGQTEIYLDKDRGTRPWHLVNSIESGTVYAQEIVTHYYFKAAHPCGLCFRWDLDIRKRNLDGTVNYSEFDDGLIREVLSQLPWATAGIKFRSCLLESVSKLRANVATLFNSAVAMAQSAAALEAAVMQVKGAGHE